MLLLLLFFRHCLLFFLMHTYIYANYWWNRFEQIDMRWPIRVQLIENACLFVENCIESRSVSSNLFRTNNSFESAQKKKNRTCSFHLFIAFFFFWLFVLANSFFLSLIKESPEGWANVMRRILKMSLMFQFY